MRWRGSGTGAGVRAGGGIGTLATRPSQRGAEPVHGGAGPALIRVLDRYLSHGGLPALPFCAITHTTHLAAITRTHILRTPTASVRHPPPLVAARQAQVRVRASSSSYPPAAVLRASLPRADPPARHTTPCRQRALRTSTSRYVLHSRLVPLYSRACTLGPIYGGMRRDACTGDARWMDGKGALRRGARRCHATPRQRGRLARHFGFGFDARQAREVASLF